MSRRWFAALLCCVLVCGALGGTARASSVEPTRYNGNATTCEQAGLLGQVVFATFDGGPTDGTYTLPDGVNTFTVSNANSSFSPSVKTFDWNSTVPIGALVVKGGANYNVYAYSSGSVGDTGMQSPLNGGGNVPNIAHMFVCSYVAPPPPPPPPPAPAPLPENALDSTFGTNGQTVLATGNNSFFSKMARQADGKIVAVGNTFNGSNFDWRIARFNTDGSLDSGFGSGGVIVRDFGDTDSLGDVVIQPDGKIVVGGYTRTAPGDAQWTVARYNTDGSLDVGFGAFGLATSFSSNSSNLLGVALQADNKIVAVGYTRGPGLLHDDIGVARYNSDGTPDSSFGSGGTVTTGLNFGGTPNDRGNAVAIQSDGKIVVFGDYDTGEHRDNVVLVRYNTDGSRDNSFNGNGIKTDNYSYHNGGRDLKLQSDGKIVVTGATCNTICDTYVARYNTDGSRDNSFGSGGVLITPFSTQSDGFNALTISPSGQILLTGFSQYNGVSDSIVSRLNPNGTFDPDFGINGSVTYSVTPSDDGASDILLQPDGKIVIGGTASNGTYSDWYLARLTENAGGQSNNQPPSVTIASGGLTDTFSAPAGTELHTYNADYQTEHPTVISNNAVVPPGFTTTTIYNHEFADGCMSMDWTGNSTNTNMSIRGSSTGFYGFIQFNGSWLLYRSDANHVIASGNLDFSGTHTYKLCAIGSTISVYRDGTLLGSGTDTGIPGSGRQAFYSEGNTLDNLSISPTLNLTAGNTYNANGSLSDLDSTSWTATVDYGDGAGAQPLSLNGTNFALSHTYQTPGTYTLAVTVTDERGASTSATEQIQVVAPPHVVSGTVYLDANNNGSKDAGEQGYAGATVHLYSGFTNWQVTGNQSVVTDSSGNYSMTIPSDTTDEYLKIDIPNGYEGSSVGIVGFGNQDIMRDFGLRGITSLPLVFSDDFTDTNGTTLAAHNSAWTIIEQGMPVTQNNTLTFPTTSDPFGPGGYVLTDQCMITDFQSPTVGIIAQHARQAPNGAGGYKGYGSDLNTYPTADAYSLSVYRDQTYIGSGISFPKAVITNDMHTLRFCVIGHDLSAYLDNMLLNSASDSTYSQGFVTYGVSPGNVLDNFKLQGTPAGPPVYAVSTNNKNVNPNNNIVATVGTTPISAGDTATVSVATGTFAGAVGCIDSKSNSYTVVADRNSGNGRLFVCTSHLSHALVSGDTITATYPGFSGISVVSVNGIAGWATSGTVLAASSANGNSASPNSGNITTGGSTVLFGVIAYGNTPTFTPGSGYTLVGQTSGGSGASKRTLNPEFRVVTSGGTYNATGTISSGGQFWQAAIVGYQGN